MNSPHHSHPWIGRSIGDDRRYRLERRLGGGGMGDVFLATDLRVGQQVALKLLKDRLLDSPEMRQRFDREISICAALHNEHIIKIMDAGVTPEGYPFYVMEYLRGVTLGELLHDQQRLTIDRTVNMIGQVCNGLLLAHQGVDLPSGEHTAAVIHRDLKPDNIFIQATDLGELVKIVDFGIAKIRSKNYQPLTLTPTFLGTARYASPEQMMGDRELDARSDIYSLGTILYEMLSGADPFGLNIQPHPISETSWIIAHTCEPPIPLRLQPGCEQLAPAMEALILRCLEKNPDLRFASVTELNLALKAVVTRSTPASNPAPSSRTILRPHPVQAGNDETRPNAIVTQSSQPAANVTAVSNPNLDTIPRDLGSIAPIQSATSAETNAQQHYAETVLSAPIPEPATQVRSRPPAPVNIPSPSSLPAPIRAKPRLPWLKLAIGAVVGLGSIGGIYLFMKAPAPAPEVLMSNALNLANEDKFPAAIDSAKKIPPHSSLYQQAQTFSADASFLFEAIGLADRGDLIQAIKLAKKISPQSPIYKKAQAYIEEWKKV
jgi:eukaryotic-like serine/threonine-protein kinase